MTASGRPPLWIVVFYSLGGFNSQAPPVSVCSQKCGSYVIDSAKGDGGGGGGGQDGKDRRRGVESLFYMLQPLHYAVEETALFPLLDDKDAKAVPEDGSLSHSWLKRRFLHVSITLKE